MSRRRPDTRLRRDRDFARHDPWCGVVGGDIGLPARAGPLKRVCHSERSRGISFNTSSPCWWREGRRWLWLAESCWLGWRCLDVAPIPAFGVIWTLLDMTRGLVCGECHRLARQSAVFEKTLSFRAKSRNLMHYQQLEHSGHDSTSPLRCITLGHGLGKLFRLLHVQQEPIHDLHRHDQWAYQTGPSTSAG